MVTFDAGTGTLHLRDSILSPRTSRQNFLSSPLAEGAIISVKNEPWCSWQLQSAPLQEGFQLHLVVYFHGSKLDFISLALGHPKFGTSWDDWSPEKEQARHEAHLRYLKEEWQAPPGEYSWGRIWAGLDPKQGDSGFSVHYK
jgi:hypothetical protein